MFNRKLKRQLAEAERIIRSFETMLTVSHLSENKSASCQFARMEIKEYKMNWKRP